MRRGKSILFVLLLLLLPLKALGEELLTLSFVGDCALADQYKYRGSATSFTTVTERNGLDYPFSQVAALFATDDLTIANCEGVFTQRKLAKGAKAMSLSAPPAFAQVFALGGVDAVNLSNNHSRDFGDKGLQDTREALEEWGIAYFGGSDVSICEVKGIKIGFCGQSYPLTDAKMRKYQQQITQLREAGCALVIASAHSGKEGNHSPNLEQRTCFPKLLEMGADVVFGHSAHVLHPIELTDKGVILYGLGNFVFGANPRPKDDDTAVIQLQFTLDGAGGAVYSGLRAIPMKMHHQSDYRPYLLTQEAACRQVWEKLVFPVNAKRISGLPSAFLETGESGWISLDP